MVGMEPVEIEPTTAQNSSQRSWPHPCPASSSSPRQPRRLGLITALLLWSAATVAFARGGDEVASFPVAAAQAGKQEAKAMAVDSAGNMIVAGYTNSGGMNNDYRVAKFTADGSGLAWPVVTYDRSGGDDTATAVAVDGNGDIVVTGYSWNGSNYDIHTIKYSGADGSLLWQHTCAGAANGNDYATAIAVDAANNIYVAGYTANGNGNDDYLIVKYPAAGATPTWTEIHDDPTYHGNDRITAIAAGPDGIAVTGYSSKGGADFDILTRKYGFDQSFVREWRRSSTGSNDDRGVAVRLDSTGNVMVTGYLTLGTKTDILTAKYAPTASTPTWEQTHDGGFDDKPRALWVDAGGNAYVTGETFTLNGHEDIYTVRYNATDGTKAWDALHHSGSENVDIPLGIVVSDLADGGVFVTGYTTTAINDNITTLKYQKAPPTATGVLLWQSTFNGSANKNDRPVGIGLASLTAPSDVLVGGWSDTTANSYDFQALRYDFGPLNAPNGLTARAISNTSITLSWVDTATNEAAFIIQRKLGETGTFADIATVPATLPANTVTYTDTGLTPNSYYYYRVRANNVANGDSAPSNEAHALTKVVSYHAPTWSYVYNGPDNREDRATGLFVGTDDHPVVTGYSDLAEEGVSGTYSFDYLTIKLDRDTRNIRWQARYDSGDGGTDMAAGVALDSSGNAIVTGTSFRMGGSDKSDDLYTIKYSTAGYADPVTNPAMLWDHQYGTQSGIDLATAVKVARNGSNQSVVIGHGMNAAGNYDMFLIKYNADGSLAWPTMVHDTGRDDLPTDVAFDTAGNLFMTGYSRNGAGDDDWYTAKFNGATGALVWSQTYAGAGAGDDQPKSLAVDTAGNIIVTGFGVNAAGDEEMVTIKYDGAAVPAVNREIWRQTHNGPAAPANGNDRGVAIAIDPIDSAVVVAGTSFVSATDSDFHLIRYQLADGALVWERNFDKPDSYDYVTAMAIDSSGYLYVTGTTRGGPDYDADFDGSADIMALIYDFEGTFLDAMTYDSTGREDGAATIAANYQGEAFVAGYGSNAANPDYVVLKQTNEYILVPAPLTLTPPADSATMHLTWRENTAGTSFQIERTLGPVLPTSSWTVVATPASGTTSLTDTGLTAGTNYCYRIYAFAGSLNSRTIDGCGTTTLAPPTLAPPTVDSTTQLTLTWSQVSGATGYKIERKIGAGAWSDLITKAADVTTHSDTGLTPGTTYSYRVSSNSAVGYSLPGNEQSAITKPVAPTLNAPTGITNTQMVLGWNTVSGAATYTLQYKLTSGSYADFAGCTAMAGTSCTVTGLSAPSSYTFQVKATNTGGDSAWSNEQTGTAALAIPTWAASTPTNITNTSMTISWVNPVVAGANITSYTLQYRLSSGSYADETTASACSGTTSLSCNVTALTPNATYVYRIKANNVSGSSNWSSEKTATAVLAAPTLSAPTTITNTQMYLAWSDPNVPGAAVTSYTLEYKEGVAGSYGPSGCPVNLNLNCTVSGLSSNKTYYFRVLATNAAGNSNWSSEVSAKTILGAPTLNSATSSAKTTMDLAWAAVPEATGYTIEQSTCNDSTTPSTCRGADGNYTTVPWATKTTVGAVTATTVTGLAAGTNYRYRIIATATGNASPVSNVRYAWTQLTTPTLTVAPASSTALTLGWDQQPGESNYVIETGPADTGPWSTLVAAHPLNTVTYAHTGLSLSTKYCYRVTAHSTEATNPPADVTSTPACGTTPLVEPTHYAPTVVSTTQINLSWSQVATNTSYEIERCPSSNPENPADHSATASCTTIPVTQDTVTLNNTGLTAGTTYRYRVRALYGAPTEYTAWSTAHWATTTPAAPVMTAPTALSTTTTQLTPTWNNVSGDNGYKLYWKTRAGAACTDDNWNGPIALAINSATHAHGGLTSGTFYCYKITATGPSGPPVTPDSAFSNIVSQTTKPSAPGTITFSGVTTSAITLTWPQVTGNGGYLIERSPDSSAWTTVGTTLTDVTTFTNSTGLSAGTRYYYRVSANSNAGYSAASAVQSTTTTPIAPTVTSAAVSAALINLSWPVVYSATNYKLERKSGGGSYNEITNLPVAYAQKYCGQDFPTVACPALSAITTSYQDSGLTENTTYCYQVRAWNTGGDSPYSAETCATTSAMPTQNLTATALNSFKVRLDWTPIVCTPDPCDTPTGYEVEKLVRDGIWRQIAAVAGTTLSFIDTLALDPARRYRYRVRAVSGTDLSPYSEATVVTPVYTQGTTTCP